MLIQDLKYFQPANDTEIQGGISRLGRTQINFSTIFVRTEAKATAGPTYFGDSIAIAIATSSAGSAQSNS